MTGVSNLCSGGMGLILKGYSFSRHKKSGFSTIELMVAVGVLALIFSLSVPFFSAQSKIVKQLKTSSNCQAILDTAFSRINSFGTSIDVDELNLKATVAPHTGGTGGTQTVAQLAFEFPATVAPNRFDPDYALQKQNIIANLALPPYSILPGRSIPLASGSLDIEADGVELYTPLMLKGTMDYLATKFNSGYCTADVTQDIPLLQPQDVQEMNVLMTGGLNNLSIKMKVSRYDMDTLAEEASCPASLWWPRPRNFTARTDDNGTTYEPQSGVGPNRFVVGKFPNWMEDKYGFRVTLRAEYDTNDVNNPRETCEGTRDFHLPEDKHNVVDFVYDMNTIRTNSTVGIRDNFVAMRFGSSCNGGACVGVEHPFETIFTNLQVRSASNTSWPEHRDRPLCSQTGSNNMDLVINLRVYNPQKEPGSIPMCLDASKQWFRQVANDGKQWCRDSYNGGANMFADGSWRSRYTGWVPCENLRICNSEPDSVTVTKGTSANSKFGGVGDPQPYLQYTYRFNSITGSTASTNTRMWGCEIKLGMAMLDMAGNLSYTPTPTGSAAQPFQALTSALSVTATDLRPGLREINPRVYFKPPPCYTCNCKPCKGGKGGGKLFAWIIFIVLVVVTGGLAAAGYAALATFTGILAVACVGGALGCYDDDTNLVADTTGGQYRSCNDSNNGCSCGHKCNKIRPPSPNWSAYGENGEGEAELEANKCTPGSTFYDGAGNALTSIAGEVTPTFAYKTANSGGGYTYLTTVKVEPGEELYYQAFNPTSGRFCVAAVRCIKPFGGTPRFELMYDSLPDADGNDVVGPIYGCYGVRAGSKIGMTATDPGIVQASPPGTCLEVNWVNNQLSSNGAPFNPSNQNLWQWSQFNEQCKYNDGGTVHTIAGNCNRSFGTGTGGGSQSQTGKPSGRQMDGGGADPVCSNELYCGFTKTKWTDCSTYSCDPEGGCYCADSTNRWCYSPCTVPQNIPETPMTGGFMRYYESYSSGAHGSLPFCTVPRQTFDQGY